MTPPALARSIDGASVRSIESLKLLEDLSPQLVVYRRQLWPANKFDYLGPGWSTLVGYTPEETYDDPELQILARPEDCTRSQQHARMGSTEPFELALLHRDGGRIWVEKTQVLIHDASGRLVGVQGVIRDVTHRRRAEAGHRFLAALGGALAGAPDLASMLQHVAELTLDHVADLCVIELVDGSTVRHRVAAHRDTAIVELLRKTPHLPTLSHLLWRVLSRRSPLLLSSVSERDVHAVVPEPVLVESLGPASYLGVPLRIRGSMVGVLHLASTMTNRRYDANDQALGEEIGRRITVAIENELLYATARRRIQVRDDVLSVVAHDLRNPLAAIKLSAEALNHAPPNPQTRARLTTIVQAVERADGLVRDLLDVARVEGGALALERVEVAPAALISEAVAAALPIAAASSVEIRELVHKGLASIHVDPGRIAQVFSNLIGNAIKFLGPTGGLVELHAWPDGASVHFEVRDNGPGIADEHLPHLFDRFWQAHRTDRRGIGLGLSISKGIVDAHGGELWATSQIDYGTTFHMTIPVA